MSRLYLIKISKIFFAIEVMVHLGAVVSVLVLDMALWVKYGLVILVLINLIYVVWRYVLLQHAKSIQQIEHNNEHWVLITKSQQQLPGELCGQCLLTNFLLVLVFRLEQRKSVVVIFKDALHREDFRKLRMILLLQ